MSNDFQLAQLQLFTQITTFVTIIPSFEDEELYLLSGQIQAFKPNQQTTVPLWLALMLKKQQKCKITPPFWMTTDHLDQLYKNQSTANDLINLNNTQFFEVSYIILNKASDDLDNPTKLRNLIDRIKDVRQMMILKKLRNNCGFFINHATTYEINKFRSSKAMIMSQLESLEKVKTQKQ